MSKKDEDYLDSLLKNVEQTLQDGRQSGSRNKSAMERLGKLNPEEVADLIGDGIEEKPADKNDVTGLKFTGDERPGIDDISTMSEYDIDKKISAAQNSAERAKKADAERKSQIENKDITELGGIDSDEDAADISGILRAYDNNVAADGSVDDTLKENQESAKAHDVVTLDDLLADEHINVDRMISQTESAHKTEHGDIINAENKPAGRIGARLKSILEKKKSVGLDKNRTDAKKASIAKKEAAKKAAAEKKAAQKRDVLEKKAAKKRAAAEKKTEADNKAAAAIKTTDNEDAFVEKKTGVNGSAEKSAKQENPQKNEQTDNLGGDNDIESLINEMNKAAEKSAAVETERQNEKEKNVSEAELMAAAEESIHESDFMGETDDVQENDEEPIIPGADTDEDEETGADVTVTGSGEQEIVDGGADEKTEEEKEKRSGKKKGRFRFGKKNKKDVSNDASGKKSGLLARFLEFLNEEDGDDEQEKEAAGGTGPDGLPTGNISDENQQVLDEVNAEGDNTKAGKGKKAKKGKKGKKNKKGEAAETEASEEGDEDAAASSKKKKKKKKEKKTEDTEAVAEKTEKLPKKKVILTVAFSVTLTVCIMVLCYVLPMQLTLGKARSAFEKADYESAYEELYGRKLNVSDQAVYNKSSIILQIDRKYEAYENYKKMGKKREGLDSLIQGVARYDLLKDQAKSYGILDTIKKTYDKIIAALKNDYGVSEKKANEIAGSKDDLTYTKEIYGVLGESMPSGTANPSGSKKTKNTSDVQNKNETQTQTAAPTEQAQGSTAVSDTAESGWAATPNNNGNSGSVSENSQKGTGGASASGESVMYIIHTK